MTRTGRGGLAASGTRHHVVRPFLHVLTKVLSVAFVVSPVVVGQTWPHARANGIDAGTLATSVVVATLGLRMVGLAYLMGRPKQTDQEAAEGGE